MTANLEALVRCSGKSIEVAALLCIVITFVRDLKVISLSPSLSSYALQACLADQQQQQEVVEKARHWIHFNAHDNLWLYLCL